jgi:hypothetical protein
LPQPRLIRIVLLSLLLLQAVVFGGLDGAAQDKAVPAVEGYITAVRSFHDFDVNGRRVSTSPVTRYGTIGGKTLTDEYGLPGALALGAYVQINGESTDRSLNASEVLYAGDWNKKVEGFGVIDKVIATGPEPVFRADGYRIRIASTTDIKFAGGLSSPSEAGTNTWIRYEGRRGPDGILQASQVTFATARQTKVKPPKPDSLPTQPSLIDVDGNFIGVHAKTRMSEWAGPCGLHRVVMDQAMQERVRRVGMKVIPEYQRQLPDDSPSKIHFRIYVVDEPVYREDIECAAGFILVPRQVVERLGNDDQLAAIMANGVAWSMMAQSARLISENLELLSALIAGDVAEAFVPGANLAAYVGVDIAARDIYKHMQEEAGRIALALMADGGYDPLQAPEAWRLLAPKRMPKDASQLKYPSRAGYQLSFLKMERESQQQNQLAPQ